MNTKSLSIAGNPNAGKTTLFNALTGSKQRTGNWAGVTVDKKSGSFKQNNQIFEVVDLPGTYSLEATSEDEQIARDHILCDKADLVINVVDAGHLERNLLLTYSLMELQRPMIVLLNMMEMAREKGLNIDPQALSRRLKVPVLTYNPTNLGDMEKFKEQLPDLLEKGLCPSAPPLELPEVLHSEIVPLSKIIQPSARSLRLAPPVLALKLLEEDEVLCREIFARGNLTPEELDFSRNRIKEQLGETIDVAVASARHRIIRSWMKEATKKRSPEKGSFTEKMDRIALSRGWGMIFFMVVMYLLFWVVTHVGGAFIDFFDILFGSIFVDGLTLLLERWNAPVWLVTLLAQGAGRGIQTVATFIPIIFSMFFMLSLLEASGYMARAAFVMDRFMGLIGLPGKAFVPMLVGFGCTVPAVLGARTLDNRRDRLLTIFLAPFMSCGARLPVYALFGAAFFPRRSGLMVFSLYLTGIFMAVITGLLLRNTLFRGKTSHFVMELPPYHIPRIFTLLERSWDRLKHFILGAGRVVVVAVLLLTFLNSLGTDGSLGNENTEKSLLTTTSKKIVPLFTPMGVEKENWPAMVGLFTGLFAKEAVVGTLSSLYSQMEGKEESLQEDPWNFPDSLKEALRSIPESFKGIFGSLRDPLGSEILQENHSELAKSIGAEDHTFRSLRRYFRNDSIRAYSYLLFILLYCPCVAALGAILKESGQGFGWLAIAYLTALAWSVATLFFQIFRGHSLFWISMALLIMGGFVSLFLLLARSGQKSI